MKIAIQRDAFRHLLGNVFTFSGPGRKSVGSSES
jgi:hypothetical protein